MVAARLVLDTPALPSTFSLTSPTACLLPSHEGRLIGRRHAGTWREGGRSPSTLLAPLPSPPHHLPLTFYVAEGMARHTCGLASQETA
mmetsp:Transcript_14966/g.45707  ORF Transcript_14966/g.45707 Transcript_14966/m.45707 type:complete len:88 (+) Transcript_14966:1214-1477(+)|eukprot:scaffold230666_cov32-Tisochrysis_lutea.AAC.3